MLGKVLEKIQQSGIQKSTPVMVITGCMPEYLSLKGKMFA
jgi:hypothetical protein